jgi:hypothetical protein
MGLQLILLTVLYLLQTGYSSFGATTTRAIPIKVNAFDTKYSDVLLDEKASKETKVLALSALQEIASLKAEVELSKKEKEISDKNGEVLNLLLKLEKANREIDEATGKFNKLVPRSIIEFVENNVFVAPEYNASMPRLQKWRHFFEHDAIGIEIYECTRKKNMNWRGELKMAERVCGFINHVNDYFHEGSHKIAGNSMEIILAESAMGRQYFNFFVCVAEKLDIRFKIAKEEHEGDQD